MKKSFAKSRLGQALISVALCAMIGAAFYSVSRGFSALAEDATSSTTAGAAKGAPG